MVTQPRDDWVPGRWFRVIGPDGKVWCETSNEDEAIERVRDGDTLQRLYERHETQWVTEEKLAPLREQSRRLMMMRRARNFLARQVVRDAAVIKELQLALEGKERETQELFNLARRGEFSEGNHYWLRCARCGGAWGRGSDHPDTQCDLMRGLVIVDDTDALRRDVMKALATPGFAYQVDGRKWITGYADSLADVVIKELRGKAQDPQPDQPLSKRLAALDQPTPPAQSPVPNEPAIEPTPPSASRSILRQLLRVLADSDCGEIQP